MKKQFEMGVSDGRKKQLNTLKNMMVRALVAVTLYWFPSLYLGKISWKRPKNLPQQMPYI
jgi:hypothetical protein